MRDSSGVTIVHNHNLRAVDTTSWLVDSVPLLEIGLENGEAPYLFSQIAGVVRLGDGRIAVGDAGMNEIREFDSTGTFVRAIGRAGGGPGEFENFTILTVTRGDSLIVIDQDNMRASRFDSAGNFSRRFTLESKVKSPGRPTDQWNNVEFFDDGTFVLRRELERCFALRDSGGFCVDSAAFFRVSESGEVLASFGTFPTARQYVAPTGNGSATLLAHMFPQPFFTVRGQNFYHADASTNEIRVYAITGGLVRIIRADFDAGPSRKYFPAEPPPGANESIMRKHRMEAAAYEKIEYPNRLPAFADIEVDATGNIWVWDAFGTDRRKNTSRWWVFDSDGVLRHALRVPALWYSAFDFGGEFGNDYLLGSSSVNGEFDRVYLYRLSKTSAR